MSKPENISDDESIALSNEELDNILNSSDLTETALDYTPPEIDLPADTESPAAEEIDQADEIIIPDDGISLTESIADTADIDSAADVGIESPVPDTVATDTSENNDEKISLSNDELDMLSDIPEEPNLPVADSEDEKITLNDTEMDMLSGLPEVSGSTEEIPATADEAGEELIALSSDEMDNILENVDETNVVDLGTDDNISSASGAEASAAEKTGSAGDEDTISLSGDELDKIISESDEYDSSEIFKSDSDTSDNVRESLDFEKSIMSRVESAAAPKNLPEEIPQAPVLEEAMADVEDIPEGSSEEEILKEDEKLIDQIHSEIDQLDIEKIDSEISIEPAALTPLPAPAKTRKTPAKNQITESDLKKIFAYLYKLLENLPEAKIREFANSEFYDLYTSIINKLGI